MPVHPLAIAAAVHLMRKKLPGRGSFPGLAADDSAVLGDATFKLIANGGAAPQWAQMAAAAHAATEDKWDSLSTNAGLLMMGETKLNLPGLPPQTLHKTPPIASRPSPASAPADIAKWLNANNGVSPLFVYPEFGWKMSADGTEATAGYDLGANDHVAWTAKDDGSWTYTHTQGGVDFGRLITTIAQIASTIGFPFVGMALDTAQAIANGKSVSDLGQALKNDWDLAMTNGQLAYAVIVGNWSDAWNAATQEGKNLQGIMDAWAPNPAPDAFGNETIQMPAPIDVANMPPPLDNPIAPGLASVSGMPKEKRPKKSRKARRGR